MGKEKRRGGEKVGVLWPGKKVTNMFPERPQRGFE